MKSKIIKLLISFNLLFMYSCTDEQIETSVRILEISILYTAIYSHSTGSTHYYHINNSYCNGSYTIRNSNYNIVNYSSCRYYSSYNGYYMTLNSRHSNIYIYDI